MSQPRVAVAGCGRWGRNHVRNHAELGSLAAIVDADPVVAGAEAARYGVPARSFDAVLADPAIDGIVFALPPSQNLPLGRRAIEAGKHLFVEKPLALTVADGEALCRAAENAGRVLMVGHILQYHPAFEALAELVAQGRLGRLLSLTSTRLDLGRIRREEDALWALAPHDVSMLLRLAGAAPLAVSARAGRHTHASIADSTTVDLAFPGGMRGEIRVSWLNPFKEQKLVAVGTSAMAVFDDREPWQGKLVVTPYSLEEHAGAVATGLGEPERVALTPGEPLRAECSRFLDAIATGRPSSSDGREALAVLAVLEAASADLARSGSAPSGA